MEKLYSFYEIVDFFSEDLDTLYFLSYLIEKGQETEKKYLELEKETEFSRYKLKKFLTYLTENDIISYTEKGTSKNKRINIKLNLTNSIVNTIMEVNNMKKQGELIPNITKPDATQELADKPVFMYPFKLNGNNPREIKEYSMQKLLQAKFGLISWKKVTNRDLAGVFMELGSNHRDLQLYEMRKINWAGSVIKNKIMNREVFNKEDFISIAGLFIDIYEEKYMNGGGGLNWNYIDKHKAHREQILDRIEKEVYQDKKLEKEPDIF